MLAVGVYANEIQVFTTNTMHIPLDPDSKVVKEVFSGTLEDFYKYSRENLEGDFVVTKIDNKIMTSEIRSTSSYSVSSPHGRYGGSNTSSDVVGAFVAVMDYTISSVVSDNEYVTVNEVKNSKNESTLIQTLIVANNSISDSEVKEISQKAFKKLTSQ
jgi:hypothetical protein